MFEPTPAELRIDARRERAFVLLARCYIARHSAERACRRAGWLVPKARYTVKQVRARLAATQ